MLREMVMTVVNKLLAVMVRRTRLMTTTVRG